MTRAAKLQRRIITIAAVITACAFLGACGKAVSSDMNENSIKAYEHDPVWGEMSGAGNSEDIAVITTTPEEGAGITGQPDDVSAVPTQSVQQDDVTASLDVPENSVYQEVNDKVTVAVTTLNLRYGPSTEYTIYRKSSQGEVFTRIGTSDNGWDKLLGEGITCYAFAAYMNVYTEDETKDDGSTAPDAEDQSDENSQDNASDAAENNDTVQGDDSLDTDSQTSQDDQNTSDQNTPAPTEDTESQDPDTSSGTDSGSLSAMTIVSMTDPLYSYTQMTADLTQMALTYPDWMRLNSLGTTEDGRNIYDAVIGNRSAKQSILVVAGIEGCNYTTTQLVMKQIEYYVTAYEDAKYDGTSVKSLLDTTMIHVIPSLNPDGMSVSQYGLDGIQSVDNSGNVSSWYSTAFNNNTTALVFSDYLKYWTGNINGVDIDKNFSYGWEGCISSGTPLNTGYKGEAPESEAETRAIAELIRVTCPEAVLCYQGNSKQITWDYGQTGELRKLSNAAVTAVQSETGYAIINYEEGTLQGGSLADWTVLSQGIPTVTIAAGTCAAPLDSSILENLWQANKDVIASILNLFR